MENILQPCVSWSFFVKQQSSGSEEDGTNWKSKIWQNTDKKPLGFRLCVVSSVWVYAGVCLCVYVL